MLAQSLALCGIFFYSSIHGVIFVFKCFMQNVSVSAMIQIVCLIGTSRVITLSTSKEDSVTVKKTLEGIRLLKSELLNRLMVQYYMLQVKRLPDKQ
jgi:hypothetical protein